MKQRLFAVRDGKVEQFEGGPLMFRTPPEAMRWFSDVVNDSKSRMFKHPGDYSLYDIGEWETDTGVLTAVTVKLVCSGMDVLVVDEVGPRMVADA